MNTIPRGWLVNKSRRQRRDSPFTLTDEHVTKLIQCIDGMKAYTKLDEEYDHLIRMRDKSLIAQAWIFFKRAKENLETRLRHIYFDDEWLMITFKIEKKVKRYKKCVSCGEKNALKANFCKKCGGSLKLIKPKSKGKSLIVTKQKSMNYPFCRYVVEYIQELRDHLKRDKDDYVYPPFNTILGGFLFHKHLTVQRFDQILQRLDPTLTSHMFRYGASEKYLRLGYTPYELKEIGDWATTHMPEKYASRKNLTPIQRRFSDDVRML